jgi:hypothetical protein
VFWGFWEVECLLTCFHLPADKEQTFDNESRRFAVLGPGGFDWILLEGGFDFDEVGFE